jgi:hypothetical protein
MIAIDGFQWDIPCDIDRTAEVTPSEISGMLLDKTYFNDVIGTYLSYDVTLAVPPKMTKEYETLYEALTAPVDAHTFVLPYNNSEIEITARVENVKDALIYTVSHKQYWRGVQFTAISCHPSKKMELGEVLTTGRSPFPETVGVPIGALYEMTATGWVETDLPDGDEVYY